MHAGTCVALDRVKQNTFVDLWMLACENMAKASKACR